jgi:2-polyprenyl-3-methyl-5-hydroxy-6-metoxy-1,4-benzoquinol methylase
MNDFRAIRDDESSWDHTSRREFVDYYAQQSVSGESRQRFEAIKRAVLAIKEAYHLGTDGLDVLDIGCNAGTNSLLWAESGHRVHGIDINEPLVEIAKLRGKESGYAIEFLLGSATALPWPDGSMDVCLMPELLEHVPEWEACLDECSRVLRSGGILFLSTTNKLCPIQQEYNLPLYSWYPRPLKRHFENLARTSKPQLASHATYPAVNWFTYYSLRTELRKRNMTSLDRFDILAVTASGRKAAAANLIRYVPPLRSMAHVATPYTRIIAIKQAPRHRA